jgi:CubicO group peptidase (beta-lactamase class C family)
VKKLTVFNKYNERPLHGLRNSLLPLTLCCLLASPANSSGFPASQGPATDENAEAIARALSEWLPDKLKEMNVPGAAVAVVDGERTVWERTFGVTDGPASSPITPETIFCIRSISKSVTALAVLLAVQEGLVDLDTPISEYLPEFTVNSRFDEHPEDLITLRHMLSHWAAFTHDPPVGIDLDRPGYFLRYIERISDTWLRFPVGYRHQYSNYGVDLAAYILQVRSGKPFADYLKEKVLEPIGMASSSFDLELVEQREDRAIGHYIQGNVVPFHFPEISAAGLYSSIRDMSKYVQFHLNGGVVNGRRLLREDLMEQYHAIQFARPGQKTGYTFGLWREVVSNTFSFYHEGGGRGFGSHMIFYPELGVGAVALTNMEYHGLTGYQGRVVMNGPIIDRYGPLPIPDPGTEEMRQFDNEDPRLKRILGRYGDSPGAEVGFENGILGIRVDEDNFFAITFFDDGGELVGMYGANTEARFLPPLGDQPGSMMTVNRIWGNSNSHYLEFNDSPSDPPGPAKPDWQKYAGEYDVLWEDNPTSTVTVSIRNGYLYFRDGKCEEYEPGLFFLYDGDTIDFRSTPATYANQEIRRKQ